MPNFSQLSKLILQYITESKIDMINRNKTEERKIYRSNDVELKSGKSILDNDTKKNYPKEVYNTDKLAEEYLGKNKNYTRDGKKDTRDFDVDKLRQPQPLYQEIVDYTNMKNGEVEIKLPDELLSKMKKDFFRARTEDNYHDYKMFHRNLCRLFKRPETDTIRHLRFKPNGGVQAGFVPEGKIVKLKPGDKLYHTSSVKGLTKLNGSHRSNGNILYPEKRIYFHMNIPGTRALSRQDAGKETIYEYTGPNNITLYKDNEMSGNTAFYIKCDSSVPVKVYNPEDDKNDTKEKTKIKEDGPTFMNNLTSKFGLPARRE